MLISTLMSFILIRKFSAKVSSWLIVVCLILISFFSVGIPEPTYYDFYSTMETYLFIWNPLPLSFPVYALVAPSGRTVRQMDALWYRFHFFSLSIGEEWMRIGGEGGPTNFRVFEYLLYYSFFMLVNIVGAVFGYWLSKTAFLDKIVQKKSSDRSTLRVFYSWEPLGQHSRK